MNENTSSAATYCIACRRPIKIVSFYRADGFGPYCSDCADIKGIDPQMAITLPPATDSPITTVKLGEPIYKYPKPLKWRMGPVPDRGVRYLIMETANPKGVIRVVTGWRMIETDKYIPLSEILELVDEE